MPTTTHEFNWPDRVVIGTIGKPGERAFYLQARSGAELASIALEKQHAALVAEMFDEMLDELSTLEGNPHSVPSHTPVEIVDNEPLEGVVELFQVGSMNLGWDPTVAQVVLEAHAFRDADTEEGLPQQEPNADEVLRVRMPVGMARAFAKRTHEIVAAGRPICSSCGHPMDPDGHTCAGPEQ
ncbi:DUF3090 domain-containing protein [Yaniella halotolerans]|uniref:DUF3090 domain-containing protein n=1 Tax=Yaniella halotolerans TaxID=225453 RepID=UPI0003B55ECC|nr:DUF3090 domain-containing protein [Yaniella halotolerans]